MKIYSFIPTPSSSSSLFFFFFWHYSSWCTLARSKIVLHCSLSCYSRLRFPTPMFFRFSSADSSHLNSGFPKCRVPSGLSRVSFLQGSSSCILQRCPSHLILPILSLSVQVYLVHRIAHKAHYCISFFIYHYR